MTILLVILTFAVFITADALLTRRREAAAARRAPAQPVPTAAEPVFVAGYQLPEGLYYHRGHTWARPEGDTVVVGLDDFARKLIGGARSVRLPHLGDWLKQGEVAFGVREDGRAADLVAPVEGEVVAVNGDLHRQPSLLADDPFGRGWVYKVHSSGLAANLRNLLSGRLARRWMEDSREALDFRLMALSGSVLQDGGEPSGDFAKHVPAEDWRRLAREFLLT
jgi:glycine cleavage system H lipoate-binding protein